MNIKQLTASAVKTARGFTATMTTEIVDHDGEVLVADGMVSKEFERNPVVLWMHDHAMPIGKVTRIKRLPSSIVADVEFAKRPEDYEGEWFPDYIAGLVAGGVLSAVSVGFREMEGGTRLATKADQQKYGMEVRRVFSRWKLLELSVVSVPANSEALISAVTKGIVSQTAAKRWGGVDVSIPQPKSVRNRISLRVPSVGEKQIADMVAKSVREEMARLTGKLYV